MAGGTTKYTVILRDEEFTLRKGQLEFDAPNYFTALFLGDFAESSTTSVTLDRNPDLFALIVEYMSGYHILPISTRALPRTMDERSAMLNLIEDAAFYGLSRLHALLTMPRQPTIDFAWTGLAKRIVSFEDVLKGNMSPFANYTTSGLCAFEGGSMKPVIIFAQNIALKLVGNRELDKSGHPGPDTPTVSYQLGLTREMKAQLERQPYSAFEYSDNDPLSLVVSVFPESRLTIDGERLRFEHFASWWVGRRAPYSNSAMHWRDEHGERVERIFNDAFPRPFEERDRRNEYDNNEFMLWGDDLLFIITARGFLAGTLQLHVKLLDVCARTRAEVLNSLKPPSLLAKYNK